MINQKRASLGLSLGLIVVLLSGCGSGGTANTNVSDSAISHQSGAQPRDSTRDSHSGDSAKAVKTNAGNADPSGHMNTKPKKND